LPIQGVATLAIFVIARGIAHGGLSGDTAIFAKHCFGPRLINWVMPTLTAFHALGSAVGPVGLSIIYDHTGSYKLGFFLYAALGLLTVVALIWVRPTYRERLAVATREP
jgi:hypothetical protein